MEVTEVRDGYRLSIISFVILWQSVRGKEGARGVFRGWNKYISVVFFFLFMFCPFYEDFFIFFFC